jgi:hypothetical protein
MTNALPCPKCGGTAMEARAIESFGKQSMLGNCFWYCFGDAWEYDDCLFEGPRAATGKEALEKWNALERKK